MTKYISIAEGGPDTPVTDAIFWWEWLGDDVNPPTLLEEAEEPSTVYKSMPGHTTLSQFQWDYYVREATAKRAAILKHQPGQHSQDTHTPKAYGKGTQRAGATVAGLMPTVAKSANWEKKMVAFNASELGQAYNDDPEVQELVDDIAGYTQGYFKDIRGAGNALAEGDPDDWAAREKAARDRDWQQEQSEYRDKLLWEDTEWQKDLPAGELTSAVQKKLAAVPIPERMREGMGDQLVHIRGGMSDYHTPRGDQPEDAVSLTSGRAMRAAVGINAGIRASEPLDAPMYRGLRMRNDQVDGFLGKQPGETMTIGGPTSFTRTEKVATAFAEGRSAGGYKVAKPGEMRTSVILQVEPGAKGMGVNTLSPYKQDEVLTQGSFEVVGRSELNGVPVLRVRQTSVPEQELPEWAKM